MRKTSLTLFIVGTLGLLALFGLIAFNLKFPEKPESDAFRFEYGGHTYLRVWTRAHSAFGTVHDPDCACYAERIKEIVGKVEERIQKKADTKPAKNKKEDAHRYIIMPTAVEGVQ